MEPRRHDKVHFLIRQDYPHMLFIHCYAYQLNLILSHNFLKYKKCGLSIVNVILFHIFSRRSSRIQRIRDREFKLAYPYETSWKYNSATVAIITSHFFEMYATSQHIVTNENNIWNRNSTALAKQS